MDLLNLDTLMFLKAIAGGEEPETEEATATGNPAVFTTDIKKPLTGLIVTFNPVQEGSGDPYAPGCGKNIFDVDTYPLTQGKYIHGGNGVMDDTPDYAATEDYIPISKYAGQTITLNKRPGGWNPGCAFYTKSGNDYVFLSGVINSSGTAGTPWTFVIPAEAEYMRFTVPINATEVQIEVGSSATSYAPYSNVRNISGINSITVGVSDGESDPTEYTTSLGNTYYSGTLNVLTGVLTVTGALLVLNTANMNNSENYPGWQHSGISEFVGTGQDRSYSNQLMNIGTVYSVNTQNNDILYLSPSAFNGMKQSDWQALAMDVQIYAEYPEPVTVQLTAQEVTDLLGQNSISADTNGTVSVIYLKKAYDEATATGNPVTFTTDVKENLTGLVLEFAPDQSGSGNASPTNYRPIAGISSAVFKHSGEDTSNPELYEVAFPAGSGIVYGGTLDAINGTLTYKWASIIYKGDASESWSIENGSNFYIMTPTVLKRNTGPSDLLCDRAKSDSSITSGTCRITYSGNFNFNVGSLIGINTVAGFKTWLASNNVQIVCKLATEYSVSVDPITIRTLKGENNIWSDANGTIDVTYLKKKT